jgi:hypothetical protein
MLAPGFTLGQDKNPIKKPDFAWGHTFQFFMEYLFKHLLGVGFLISGGMWLARVTGCFQKVWRRLWLLIN